MNRLAFSICILFLSLCLLACSKTSDEIFIDGMIDYIHIVVDNDGNCEKTVRKLDKFVEKNGEKMGIALASMVKTASKQISDEAAQSPLQIIADEIEYILSEEEYRIARHPACAEEESFKAVQARFGEILLKPVFQAMAADIDEAIH